MSLQKRVNIRSSTARELQCLVILCKTIGAKCGMLGESGFQVMVFWGQRALNLGLKILSLNPNFAILSPGDCAKFVIFSL